MLPFDSAFENLKREIEDTMKHWSAGLNFPSLFEIEGIRLPLCDIADKGNRYEIQLEVPGIEGKNVKVKATNHAVEVSAQKSQRTKEGKTGYVYTELSKSSFYRLIPVAHEIVPSRIKSKVNNGLLTINAPKKNPTKN